LAVIESMGAMGGKLYVGYLENVSSHLKVYEPDGKYIRDIELPAIGSIYGIVGRWDGTEAFIGFSSYHIPDTFYRLDLINDKMEVFQKSNIPFDAGNVVVNLKWYESKDGTKVPMFLVHHNDIALDGNNPTMLTGYGGFGVSRTPSFRVSYGYWVESGGILAVPCLRGGGEFGETWHQAAMLEKKQNSFDDFIAAAEWLIENKYTSSSKLSIRGGSNGGLLVGAFMNQRPELCKAVICTYPLLDMVRFHKFLMGPYWIGEYGSADNAEHFEFIYKYSPYHNVKQDVVYPSVIYVTGDGDTRVAPLHARKMTALMQDVNGSNNPVLLHYDTKAGHSAGTSVSKDLEEIAVQMGFLFWQLGVTP
jgi:prolyl oligopeptidase